MPKKATMCFVMQDYPPLSSRRLYNLGIQAVHKSKAGVRFELAVLDDPRQVGRTVLHHLPAVLTPKSPLARFLVDAFAVRLSERQSIDLAQFVGRRLLARFDKCLDGCLQAIASIKPYVQPPTQADQANAATDKKEQADGLG